MLHTHSRLAIWSKAPPYNGSVWHTDLVVWIIIHSATRCRYSTLMSYLLRRVCMHVAQGDMLLLLSSVTVSGISWNAGHSTWQDRRDSTLLFCLLAEVSNSWSVILKQVSRSLASLSRSQSDELIFSERSAFTCLLAFALFVEDEIKIATAKIDRLNEYFISENICGDITEWFNVLYIFKSPQPYTESRCCDLPLK